MGKSKTHNISFMDMESSARLLCLINLYLMAYPNLALRNLVSRFPLDEGLGVYVIEGANRCISVCGDLKSMLMNEAD